MKKISHRDCTVNEDYWTVKINLKITMIKKKTEKAMKLVGGFEI